MEGSTEVKQLQVSFECYCLAQFHDSFSLFVGIHQH
jgi:hypothetical protein